MTQLLRLIIGQEKCGLFLGGNSGKHILGASQFQKSALNSALVGLWNILRSISELAADMGNTYSYPVGGFHAFNIHAPSMGGGKGGQQR